MDYSKGIVYAVVGERDVPFLSKSIELVRKFDSEIPITVYHDIPLRIDNVNNITLKQYERVKYPDREENRNSSLWRLIALRDSPYDHTLYLDNDIFIVHSGFFEGFKIAMHYGIAMVQNPLMFIKTNEGTIGDLDIGADVQQYDKDFCSEMPSYMTAYNMGVMFHNKNHEPSKDFLNALIDEQQLNPSRGQAGLYRTIWKTKQAPYCLPINWLVCRRHCNIDNPLALHVGHENILGWWRNKFQ